MAKSELPLSTYYNEHILQSDAITYSEDVEQRDASQLLVGMQNGAVTL